MSAKNTADRPETPGALRRSLRLITAGGMLAMVFMTGTTSPLRTEFFRQLGAQEVFFGVLGGIPLIMLFMQFVGAALCNQVHRRKPLFMSALILGRLLLVPAAVLPLCLHGPARRHGLAASLVLIACSAALQNTGGPSWFSWMADLVPSGVLNRYWGSRQRWMYLTWTASFVAIAALTWVLRRLSVPVLTWFPFLVGLAVTAGVVDILLFARVHEPPNVRRPGRPSLRTLLDPVLHSQYRTFVVFSCVFRASQMFVASFMQLYALKMLGLEPWQVTLIWCCVGVGNALVARQWGRVADRHGQRPLITLCVSLKPAIVLVFLVITPRAAVWVLPVAFLFDSMLNAGMQVAQNGYMMKIAPRRNRSMFVAAINGFAGLCGGLSAMAGGFFLKGLEGFSFEWAGREWTNYHLLFAVGFVIRGLSLLSARRIREPRSSRSLHVLNDIAGTWPAWFLRFPVGLYRVTRDAVSSQGNEDKT